MITTVTGIFTTLADADRAVRELHQSGFSAEEISVVRAEDDAGSRAEERVTVGTGASIGLLTGASLGGLAGSVPGLLAGAAAGGMLGALIDLGVPEDSANSYRDEAEAGRAVILVRTERVAEAADVLRLHGAREVSTRPSATAVS